MEDNNFTFLRKKDVLRCITFFFVLNKEDLG